MKITPREYQVDTIDKLIESYNQNKRRLLCVLGTGLGKTFISTEFHKRFKPDEKSLFLVDRIELAHQARESFLRSDPTLKVGLEMNKYHASKQDDVVIACVHTIGRKGSYRIGKFGPEDFTKVFVDEAHVAVSDTYSRVLNYLGVGSDNLLEGKVLVGLSVGKESTIELSGNIFGGGWIGEIEDAWNMASEIYPIQTLQGKYKYIEIPNLLTRSYEEGEFIWKELKKLIKHPADKEMYELTYQGGRLEITNDHSVYVYNKDGMISEKLTEELTTDDVLVYDTPSNYQLHKDEYIDVIEHCINNKIEQVHVSIDLSSVDRKMMSISSKDWYSYKNSKYGNRLPIKVYWEFRNELPAPKFLYYEGGSGNTKTPIKVKSSDYAYLIGQYIGDGYRKDNGISICISDDESTYLLDYLQSEHSDIFGISVKDGNGKSKEIHITNKIIFSILDELLIKGVNNKTIHNEIIFNWSEDSKRKLLSGLIDSDGSLSVQERNKKSITITTTSKPLSISLGILLKSLGIVYGLYETPPKRGGIIDGRLIKGTNPRYDIKFSYYQLINQTKGKKGNRYNFKDGKGVKISSICKIDYEGYVYDIEMEGHPSFVTNNILVHNTATPNRTDGVGLKTVFDEIVVNYDLKFGIKEGWLTDIDIVQIETGIDISGVHFTQNNTKDLSKLINVDERNALILKAYKEVGNNEQAIIYATTVEHAHAIADLFNAAGIKSFCIEANTDSQERREATQAYRRGEIKVLTNYGTLTVGFDAPETSLIILARPIKSELILRQIVGRGIRPSKFSFIDAVETREQRKRMIQISGKPSCKVVDIYDILGDHDIVSVPSLFGLNNNLKIPNKQERFYEEVVERLEELERETQVDMRIIDNLDDIDLIVKHQRLNIESLKTPEEVSNHTDRPWLPVGEDKYEIVYNKDKRTLIIEKNMLDKYELLEYDSERKITKKLQEFYDLSAALSLGDRYANEYFDTSYVDKRDEWATKGVTRKQMNLLVKLFRGGIRVDRYNEYPDTEVPHLYYRKTGERLDQGLASNLISQRLSRK